jgi:polyisoprenoid-binding protein YceI
MSLAKMEGSFTANKDAAVLKSITGANFKCRADALLSDNSIMDSKAHEALRAASYPEISFSNTACDRLTSSAGNISGYITGDLSLAGKSKRIRIPFQGSLTNQTFIIEGSHDIRMSDFGIKPPTAMLGALKTGDEITIKFRLVYLAGAK